MNFIAGDNPKSREEGVYLVRIKHDMGNSTIGYHVATWMGTYWHISGLGLHHSHFTVTHYMVIEEPVPLGPHEVHEDSLGRMLCVAQTFRKPDLSIPVGKS